MEQGIFTPEDHSRVPFPLFYLSEKKYPDL
jgi:hypothetical protein